MIQEATVSRRHVAEPSATPFPFPMGAVARLNRFRLLPVLHGEIRFECQVITGEPVIGETRHLLEIRFVDVPKQLTDL